MVERYLEADSNIGLRCCFAAVVFSAVLLKPDPSATPDALPLASLPQRKKRFVSLLLTAETA